MTFIVECMDDYYGPFATAGEAAEWATGYFAEHILKRGWWKVLRVRKP